MAESLFSTIKTELIYRQRWDTRHDAELAIFSYVEGFYNPERIQDALGMLSPDEFEALHLTRQLPPAAADQDLRDLAAEQDAGTSLDDLDVTVA